MSGRVPYLQPENAINDVENTVRGKDAIIVGGQLGQIAGIDTPENAGQETGTLTILAVAGGAGIQELGGVGFEPACFLRKDNPARDSPVPFSEGAVRRMTSDGSLPDRPMPGPWPGCLRPP
ncbi:hypothetical protein ROG8370_03141 [Roseovarius gaetbuli]|uniref:Uncharacterized protein n=1 Tax=Roseovarius gaetbuli TaxID=1356575 RepID=A0A1X7A1A7_9RHOB|nr:hypothetical protein ROG8370_03141 [Roseovarius gaetbuli]